MGLMVACAAAVERVAARVAEGSMVVAPTAMVAPKAELTVAVGLVTGLKAAVLKEANVLAATVWATKVVAAVEVAVARGVAAQGVRKADCLVGTAKIAMVAEPTAASMAVAAMEVAAR